MKIFSHLKTYSEKTYHYMRLRTYYAPPMLRYTFLNIFGFQVARSLYESIRFRFKQCFWEPHDSQFSLQIRKNGILTIEDFLEQEQYLRLIEAIENIIQRERAVTSSKLIVFKDPIALRLNINLPYLNSIHGRLDTLAWEIWNLIPYERVKKYAEDVISSTDHTEKQIEVEYISVPHDQIDHYDHNTWWHIDRHFHCAKAFLFIDHHEKQNGTYEFIGAVSQSKVARLYYQYAFSVRSYFNYIYAGFNTTKMVKQNILKPRVSNLEYRLLGLKPSPVVAPGNTLLVSDNIGFHRRGKLSPGTKRVQCNFIFYKNRIQVFHYFVWRFASLLSVVYKFAAERIPKKSGDPVTAHKLENSLELHAIDAKNDIRWRSILSKAFEKNAEYKLFRKAASLADMIFDVGANYGMFSFGAYPLSENATLHAFEPNPRLYESMRLTISSNDLNPNQVRINQIGVSSVDSKLAFVVNEVWSGSSKFKNQSRSDEPNTMDVEVLRLDSYIEKHSISIANKTILLKIDVEGFDLKALEGAEKLLTACSGYFLTIELDGKQFKDSIPGEKLLKSLFRSSPFRFAVFTEGMVIVELFCVPRGFLLT